MDLRSYNSPENVFLRKHSKVILKGTAVFTMGVIGAIAEACRRVRA